MGLILDVVPNHMAADDANAFWADPELRRSSSTSTRRPAAGGASSTSTSWPACARRTRRSSRRRTALVLALVREGVVDGLRIDHPDGLADPAGYLERLGAGGAEHVWVEKILDPDERLRDWPVDGHGRLRVRQRRHGAVLRPGGRGGAHRASRSCGRRRAVRRAGGRGQARAGARRRSRREVDRLRRMADLPRTGRVAWRRCPIYRTYVAATARVGRGPRGARAAARGRRCAGAAARRAAAATSSPRASSRRRRR